MRFDKLTIGQKFVYSIGMRTFIFEKKSLSSGYVLDPESLTRIHLTVTFSKCDEDGSFLGFAKSVEVHPLAC